MTKRFAFSLIFGFQISNFFMLNNTT